jgi:hypothetical protein
MVGSKGFSCCERGDGRGGVREGGGGADLEGVAVQHAQQEGTEGWGVVEHRGGASFLSGPRMDENVITHPGRSQPEH